MVLPSRLSLLITTLGGGNLGRDDGAVLSTRNVTNLRCFMAVLVVVLWSAASLLADSYGTCQLDGFDETESECVDTTCQGMACAFAPSSCVLPFGIAAIPTLSRLTVGLGIDRCRPASEPLTLCDYNTLKT